MTWSTIADGIPTACLLLVGIVLAAAVVAIVVRGVEEDKW